MKINWSILLSSLILCMLAPTYGRFHFTKLSAKDVYNALRDAGRLDAIPEGRVVTQGIAAATGFLAGITKGIAIPMLAGLALSSFNSNSTTGQTVYQEICFSSRSANEIDESEKTKNNEKPQKRSDLCPGFTTTTTPAITTPSTGTITPAPTSTPTTTSPEVGLTPTTTSCPSTSTTGATTSAPPTTSSSATSPTTTATATATASPTTTATNTAATTTDGSGTGTNTETTTQSGTGGSMNCIIVPQRVAG